MPVPVLGVEQMRSWEQASWKAGRSQLEVIRRVGHLVAERAHGMLKRGDSVVALYGRGNNGQDVLQACRLFIDHEVHRIEAIHPQQTVQEFRAALALKPALILDGIFGTGLSRPLEPDFQEILKIVNDSEIPVLSVDLPSGLDADTGEPAGGAIKAHVTLTLGAPKRGLLAARAWPYVGRLEVAPQIGLIDCPHASDIQWTLPSDFAGFPRPRSADGHKGTFGHVAILAGSLGYHGAAILAARAAQRAQPGLITLLSPPEVYPPIAAQLQAVMVRPLTLPLALPENRTSILIGPGMAHPNVTKLGQEAMLSLWRTAPVPVVVDASGLDWLTEGICLAQQAVRVITPHPGEAARLLGWPREDILTRRFEAVRELSDRYGGCWVVLKGYQTVVGRNVGELFVNSSGNPELAQGGSGDVLAGWLTGLLAQERLAKDPSRTIRYAVWKHGAIADELQRHRPNWTIEDLVAWPTFVETSSDNRPSVLPDGPG